MLKILNAEPLLYSEKATRVLREIGALTAISLDRFQLLACIDEFNVLIVRLGFKLDREVIDAGTHLKVIVTATTGLDHIDVEYASGKGIRILSLQGETEFLRSVPATAEHTWALLLALTRNIPRAVSAVQAGQWNRDELRGHDLAGHSLGIVGLGRIGEMVARYGLVFGMKVAAFDPYRNGWMPEVTQSSTLSELLASTNILSLHVPLNDETYHMIGTYELSRLPKQAVLVNTARGGVLDSVALLESLLEGHLAGAALDVIEGETDKDHATRNLLLSYMSQHANLIITPHIGGATHESMSNTELFMAHKLKEWFYEQA